ncbi:TetR/AcrR family transcriptional regulator [Streptomyces yaizuensis]|uniref:TetR/AcrR family transcriptional regulator n=1 Tax=Streptomyces yaizuensis TaxID=2989713 RepID=A0ABQ5NWK7_9ACTN|nr:TetR/AcrR family transcriptional regulator [Streptomyces sp. YSPA8]GLF94757.1 TetR/AcrR family transcriptional regulator [Streptomyces sp. YSPA8]
MNPARRNRLREAAIVVLADAGGRGLTHRAVDLVADVPPGTAKNYFPTRDALLRAAAERCVENYQELAARMAAAVPVDGGREDLVTLVRGLLANAAGPGRPRLLAYRELQAEAGRRPWLAEVLDPIAAADFAWFGQVLRTADPSVTPARATLLTLVLHGALTHLSAGGARTLDAAGLDDPDRFARELLAVALPG